MAALISLFIKFLGGKKMPVALIIGIVVAVCAVAIPVSVKYLGQNNVVEQDAEQIIEKEGPELLKDIESPAVEAVAEASLTAVAG